MPSWLQRGQHQTAALTTAATAVAFGNLSAAATAVLLVVCKEHKPVQMLLEQVHVLRHLLYCQHRSEPYGRAGGRELAGGAGGRAGSDQRSVSLTP